MKKYKIEKLAKMLLLSLILVVFMSGVIPLRAAFAYERESEIVIDSLTKKVLYEKNADIKMPMASTTKILTALTVLKHCDIKEIVKVSKNAEGVEGSSIYLKTGDELTVEELLYGLMLRSGNDAAVALAEYVGKTTEKFVAMMNEAAKEIGAVNSNFVTPNGLDDENHYTTAYDLALITAAALENETFSKIVACKKYRRENGEVWYNKNKILSTLDGGDGVKTGYTKKAGRCLVASASRKGARYIAVVLNCPPMFERCSSLLNDAFEKYSPTKICDDGKEISFRVLSDGVKNKKLSVRCEKTVVLPVEREKQNKVFFDVEWDKIDGLPVKKGQTVGKIHFYLDKDLIFSCKLVTINEIEKCKLSDAYKEVGRRWSPG